MQVYAGSGLIRLTYVRQWRVQASHLLLCEAVACAGITPASMPRRNVGEAELQLHSFLALAAEGDEWPISALPSVTLRSAPLAVTVI